MNWFQKRQKILSLKIPPHSIPVINSWSISNLFFLVQCPLNKDGMLKSDQNVALWACISPCPSVDKQPLYPSLKLVLILWRIHPTKGCVISKHRKWRLFPDTFELSYLRRGYNKSLLSPCLSYARTTDNYIFCTDWWMYEMIVLPCCECHSKGGRN